MRKLIITADDYGMCPSVNRAIEACAKSGVVLSTNVMPNMEFADDAAEFRQNFPEVSVGIHFNFTVGKPLSPREQVSTLIREDGTFLSYKEIREKCKAKTYSHDEVRLEMQAQYRRYFEICGCPDYWNTHENVHVHPWLYRLFCDVALELGIIKMRTHRRIYIPASNGNSDKSFKWFVTNPIKQIMLTNWRKQCVALGIHSPDGLLVRMNEADKLDLPYVFAHIAWKRNEIAEIAIHPALDLKCKYFGEITDARIKEYECFSQESVVGLAQQNNICITNFDSL